MTPLSRVSNVTTGGLRRVTFTDLGEFLARTPPLGPWAHPARGSRGRCPPDRRLRRPSHRRTPSRPDQAAEGREGRQARQARRARPGPPRQGRAPEGEPTVTVMVVAEPVAEAARARKEVRGARRHDPLRRRRARLLQRRRARPPRSSKAVGADASSRRSTSTRSSRCPTSRPTSPAAGSRRPPAPARPRRTTTPSCRRNETGAVAFKRQHPTWDGRGVTIGILDCGSTSPTRRCRRPSTGERKIVDWFTATDPLTRVDGTWRAMLTSA